MPTYPPAAWPSGSIPRANLQQEASALFAIKLTDLAEKTNLATRLPTPAATTNMGLIDNTVGTAASTVQTIDQKAANASAYARFQFAVPNEYVAGQALKLRINAGMLTTVADTTATLGVNCYRNAAPTVDLNTTAAQSMNSLVAANFDFTLTPTSVVPGDILDVLVTVAIHDAATGTAVIGKINSLSMILSVKG
ncbi:MAG: hypothetical protein ABSG68_11350, partial [Thermoguttaceae bacterium]|jgi:hypothetical protein